eukprot:XP_001700844.1 predicted protein [Chlamydomonas reinhardtii]
MSQVQTMQVLCHINMVPKQAWRSSHAKPQRYVKAGAAPHPSSTSTATATASALASNSPSVFSKLGLGSRTSDTVDATPFTSSASSHLELGPGGAAAAVLSSGAGGAGAALVRSLRHAASRLGTSIERLLYDGVAESMPAWSPGQACAVLMTLALLRRRPDDEWLSEFYALTAARLSECNEAELAMLSYVRVESIWLGRFLEAMGPRLRDLSGCDLRCLLLVAAEACGPDVMCPEPPSRDWQAQLYARMDGVNWSLQGRNLVGCLDSIATLGLRPPAPWMAAAVAALLPGSSLVELCEAWQALAEAEGQVAEAQGDVSGSGGPALSKEVHELRELVAAWLAQSSKSQLSASDVPHVLSSLAAAGAHVPGPALAALVGASEPLLGGLTCGELVTVALSLVRLAYRPNMAWQSAFCAASRRRLGAMTAPQRASLLLANVLWAVSCVAPEPPAAWLTAWEYASMPRLRELGPNMLAVVLKAMSTLHYRPSRAWHAPSTYSGSGSTGSGKTGLNMLSNSVTPESLNSIVYSLASLDLDPPAAWLDELMDAVRCKLSMLSTLDLSVVLAFLVARNHRPNDEWWDSFLEALQSRFESLSAIEMASQLIMLNALKVSPTAEWLDGFCQATQTRLAAFGPSHLLQVLSCLHLFRHRPCQTWMGAYMAAVEASLGRFTATELARVLMLLDHLNQRPSAAFMTRFYDVSVPGLSGLEPQELVNCAWAAVSCSSVHPNACWTDALVAAARPRLSALSQPQLRVLVAALGHMQRSTPTAAAADFLAFAREFLVV